MNKRTNKKLLSDTHTIYVFMSSDLCERGHYEYAISAVTMFYIYFSVPVYVEVVKVCLYQYMAQYTGHCTQDQKAWGSIHCDSHDEKSQANVTFLSALGQPAVIGIW